MAKRMTRSVRVDGPDGEYVRVLFYDDRSVRFRITNAGPMVITEAYLQGKGKHVILGVTPAHNI
ncbi:hypothetical protein ACFLXF_04745, partial [Chloroflexota bacterium]